MGEIRLVPLSDYENDCRILEIERGASLAEIRQAYRDQTKVWHPDRFSNDIRLKNKAEEKLKRINLAYRRLCGLCSYEPRILNYPTEPCDWSIALFALRRAFRRSMIVISNRFWLAMATAADLINSVFQSLRRETRSLAIAMTAFVLGFALAAWLLPRESDTWAKISGLRHKIIERTRGIAEADVTNPTPTDPIVLSQTALVTTSSPETGDPPHPPSLGTGGRTSSQQFFGSVNSRLRAKRRHSTRAFGIRIG